jgi:hypothetical protein
MRHPVRRLAGLPALLLGSALFLAPGAALADHDDHRRRGEDRHRLGSFHESRGLKLYRGWRFSPRVVRHRHHARAASYYCARCHHGFHRQRAFHRHLHRDHAVPFARLPFVIVHTSFGWVFGG